MGIIPFTPKASENFDDEIISWGKLLNEFIVDWIIPSLTESTYFSTEGFICISSVGFWRGCPYMLLSLSMLILLILMRFFVFLFCFLSKHCLKQWSTGKPNKRPFCRPGWWVKSVFAWERYLSSRAGEAFHVSALRVCRYWRWRAALFWPWELIIIESDFLSGDMNCFEFFFFSPFPKSECNLWILSTDHKASRPC